VQGRKALDVGGEPVVVHREIIERYPGPLVQLAAEIADLRYDALAAFLQALAAKLGADADADAGRGRPKLAAALRGAAVATTSAAAEIQRAWSVSAPYM
jgi:hypothetical protein